MDSDDYIESDTCQKLLSFTIENPDIIIGDAIVEGGVNRLKHIEYKGHIDGNTYLFKAMKARRAPMAAWLNIYNRSFLIKNGLKFKYGILHEDEEFTPRVLLCAKKIALSGVNFYHYIIREDSITTKNNKKKNLIDFYSTCEELEKIYKKISNNGLKQLLLDSLVSKYLTLYVTADAYKYGNKFYHKLFLCRNVTGFSYMTVYFYRAFDTKKYIKIKILDIRNVIVYLTVVIGAAVVYVDSIFSYIILSILFMVNIFCFRSEFFSVFSRLKRRISHTDK